MRSTAGRREPGAQFQPVPPLAFERQRFEARYPLAESTSARENATDSSFNALSKRPSRRANASLGVRTRQTYGGIPHIYSTGTENVAPMRRSSASQQAIAESVASLRQPAFKKDKVDISTSSSATVLPTPKVSVSGQEKVESVKTWMAAGEIKFPMPVPSASMQVPPAMQRNSSVGPNVLNDVTNTSKDLPRANSVGNLCTKLGPHSQQLSSKHHKASAYVATTAGSMSVASTSVASATASVASASVSLSRSNSTTALSTTPICFDGDAKHEKDPQHVVEYLPEIYCRMRDEELKHLPTDFDYMKRQTEVNPRMRAILNDWIVDVHKKFKLRTETLFLAVDLIDRFLGCCDAKRKQLQLIGVTALLIASKFEEIYPPPVHELVEVTDNAYKKEEVVEMELSMLRVLDFQVCRPTSVQFLTRFQHINGCKEFHRCLTQFFLEMMLIEYAMIKYSPSHVAATAVLLCNKLCRCNPCWTCDLEVHTGSNEKSLKQCMFDMFEILKKAENNPMQAVRRKFGTNKYQNVSKHRFVDSREVFREGRAARRHISVSPRYTEVDTTQPADES